MVSEERKSLFSQIEMEFVAESNEPILGGKFTQERKTLDQRYNSGANRVYEMGEKQ